MMTKTMSTIILVCICEYSYDAWGNLLSMTGDTALASLNPIRYRGYYQDTETGLYYLQSRYYDPTTMRFINADDPNIIQMGAAEKQELNLYAYCTNDPVNHVNPTGYDAVLLLDRNGAKVGAFPYGHMAAFVFSGSYWYYFSLNGNYNGNSDYTGKAYCDWIKMKPSERITRTMTCSTANTILSKYMRKANHKYTDLFYIGGDFSYSATHLAKINSLIANKMYFYNVLGTNCSQVVFQAFMSVRFSSYWKILWYYDTFSYAASIISPNIAFDYVKRKLG